MARRHGRGFHFARWTARAGHALVSAARALVVAVKESFADNALDWAAAIAFYTILSLFPLLLLCVAIVASFVDADWAIRHATAALGSYVPQGSNGIAQAVRGAIAARRSAGILSLLALFWSGSRVFGVMTTALNVAFDVKGRHHVWRRLVLQFALTLSVGVVVLVVAGVGLLRDALGRFTGAAAPLTAGVHALAWVASAAVLATVFTLIYQFVPRGQRRWRASMWGAATATSLVLAARPLFLGYVHRFAGYNLIYGSFAIVIIVLLWAWLAAVILLFGGEVASGVGADRSSPDATSSV